MAETSEAPAEKQQAQKGTVAPEQAAQYVRPGLDYGQLALFVDEKRNYYLYMGHRRVVSEARWRRGATLLAWLTAALAAVSGITAISSNEQVAIILALATASIAATNAALNPADVARKHRTAALVLRRLSNRLVDILFFQLQDNHGPVPIDELKQIRTELTSMDAEILALNQDGMVLA